MKGFYVLLAAVAGGGAMTRMRRGGGGAGRKEGFRVAAGGGGGGGGWGVGVGPGRHPGGPARRERAAAPPRDRRLPRLLARRRRRLGRGDRIFRFRVPVLRVARDRADARDPRAAHRDGEGALALSRLPPSHPPVLALRGARRAVRRRAGEVLGAARPALHQPPMGADREESALPVPGVRQERRPRPRQVRRLHGRPALRRPHPGEPPGRRGARYQRHADVLRERQAVRWTPHLRRVQGPGRQPDETDETTEVMRRRQAIVVLALVGLLVATYLWLYKIGVIGVLQCGTGSCEAVQPSRYAVVFGVPVAFVGVAGYAVLFAIGLVDLQPAFAANRRVTVLLAALATAGFAFTLYLTYLELFVLHAICRWCVVSAAIMTAIWVVAVTCLRRTN